MGTRGLLGLIIARKRYGSYNHWDSYPAGLGRDIVKFLAAMTSEEWDEMARLLKNITWVDDDDRPSKELQDLYSGLGYFEPSVASGRPDTWYCLLRKLQGVAALEAIKSGNLKHVIESVTFQQDTLFCEWSYFVDFEKRVMETWDGSLLDTTSFEDLKDLGADRYVERIEQTVQALNEEAATRR